MKKLAITIVTSLCAVALFAAETNAVKSAVHRPRRPRRPSAGILERPESIPSRQIGVYNLQQSIAADRVAAAVVAARRTASLPLKLNAEKSPVRIEIVANDEPSAMVLYPEQFKAIVNVKALAADGASAALVERRLQTELARAALFVLGSGMVAYNCLTKSVKDLAGLDSLTNATLSAEAITHLGAGRALGINMISYTSYERACQEGWAPPPANDIQKAVWDKVHSIPEKPLTIKFDKKEK